jgi:hypothetical protein
MLCYLCLGKHMNHSEFPNLTLGQITAEPFAGRQSSRGRPRGKGVRVMEDDAAATAVH